MIMIALCIMPETHFLRGLFLILSFLLKSGGERNLKLAKESDLVKVILLKQIFFINAIVSFQYTYLQPFTKLMKKKLIVSISECGRTLQENTGSFTSPSYARETKSTEGEKCEWRITATHGERIVLNITGK